MEIAILLTCFNRRAESKICLSLIHSNIDSLNSQKVRVSIFLVDDGSNDGTSEMVTEDFPNVNLIKGNGNLFWNRGMYKAWEIATQNKEYDFYLWLNDDTFLIKNGLQILLEGSRERNDRAIIVGATKSVSTHMITYGGRDKNNTLLIPNGVLQPCHHFNGNIVLIPKYVYKVIGKLDPIFHHALGDFDYGLRAKKKRIKIYLASEIIGFCEIHGVFAKWCQVEIPFQERIKLLYKSSCDSNPYQQFVFEKRHFGFLKASFHWLTIHIRVAFPAIWRLKLSK